MKLDAHQHFWKFDPVRDAWIGEDMQLIRRDFMPEDLKPELDKHQLDGCIAVQADQSEEENEFLLSLSAQHPWIKGVVGWLDLLSDTLPERIDYYNGFSAFKGVRHILQAEPDGYMTQRKFVEGISSVGKSDLTYDILAKEGQLTEVLKLIKQLPEMRLVLDHIGKPDIKNESFAHWATCMKSISELDHVYVKLSGMATEADWATWQREDLQRYVDCCLENFGPSRLMYGSDWPVCLVAGSYDRIHQSLMHCLQELSSDEQNQIMGKTAKNFYQIT
ncbi:amidohydrolase family protein [Pontibacter sp. E15-1]|uniref:amidohydrolase family protein n=1 Tax=Pontibacter sp. E15-1 TaxID=2919918 RepID=UPI001F4FC38D|nr:amidohydrolase family protein [Pontibacter sp. E15-1]MCJ8165726.1 amidohydrolase family protein [Pontibacter sp. E15-1]